MSHFTFTSNEATLLAGAMSSVASVLAVIAVRTTNKLSRAQSLPILEVNYNWSNDKIVVRNSGTGPAFNLTLQAANIHYTNIKQLIHLNLDPNGKKSILPNEKVEVSIEGTSRDGKKFQSLLPTSYEFLKLSNESQRSKSKVGIVFEDITGKRYLAKLRFYKETKDAFNLETRRIVNYSVWARIKDSTEVAYFKLGKKLREQQASKSQD